MKKFFSVLTLILSILFVAVAIPVTIYILQNQKFNFQINAFLNDEPQSVKVVDIRGTSVKITWITEKAVIGLVKFSADPSNVTLESASTKFHMLEIKNLQANKEYAFILLSDGVEYSKPEYKFTTSSIINEVGSPYLIYGQIFSKDGSSIQPEGLVYVQLRDTNSVSDKIPALLNKAGGFQVNLNGVMDSTHLNLFGYDKSIDVSVETIYDVSKPSVIRIFTLDLSNNRQIPNIYLADINIDVIPGVNGN